MPNETEPSDTKPSNIRPVSPHSPHLEPASLEPASVGAANHSATANNSGTEESGLTPPVKGQTATPSEAAQTKLSFWRTFFPTFVTIFLAEIGDKTQVTTLLMSAESQSPWVVFLGAASALIATSLIGVLLGQWLANRVSAKTLDTLAAVMLLFITVGLVADVLS
ncbi:MAG: TMEM165/GDT1 family protein [Cyanobacteria bacterium P01_A01_bin.114]